MANRSRPGALLPVYAGMPPGGMPFSLEYVGKALYQRLRDAEPKTAAKEQP